MSKSKPGKFVYKKREKPKCIGGHEDHIIPIVYGEPSEQVMGKAQLGLIHLGGCVMTDDDPKFYCTIHEREL